MILGRNIFSTSLGLLILLVVAMLACKKDKPVPDLGYSYFPDKVGHWVIYEMDSTVYDDFNNDTVHYRYQIRELIESEFNDNQGRRALRIERYRRPYIDTIPYDQLPWTLSRVWAATLTSTTGERVEENQRYVRLIFPTRNGKTWDGNAQNALGFAEYEYEAVDQPYVISTFAFDSTLRVLQENKINLVEHIVYNERYARHVGLIEKNVIDVYDDTIVFGVPVLDRIRGGVKYTLRLVDYGPH
jgi:hypothetical protein